MYETESRRQKDRVRESQRWAESLPSNQPCSHSSRRPDRQHALLLFTLQVKEVSGPILLVCVPQRLCWREKNTWARASGGLRCSLSNRHYNVVTGFLKICPSLRPKILSKRSFHWKFSNRKTIWFLTWSISHVLNSVYPGACKNTGVISP